VVDEVVSEGAVAGGTGAGTRGPQGG
jgi:hypothetical protein